MANRKYLESSGVTYLWTKIKQFVSSSIPAIKVNNKPIDTQGNVDVFATDIKMESGSNVTIPSKLTEYVKSVNGNTPNPITGDVIIETGGGGTNATTGFLEISVGIPVASWVATTSGYQYTVSNSAITTSMRVVEAWFDDDSVQTDTMTITTPSDGTLLIQTPTKPTEPWALHVALGYDGANAISEYRNEFAEALAVHATGNTNITGAIIPANTYVYLTGNSTIDDGMYVSTVDIAVNDGFTGGNLTSVANGGLNGLQNNIKTSLVDLINSKITSMRYNVLTSGSLKTWATNTSEGFTCFRYNNSVTDTPCDYGHGYVIHYHQNIRIVVFDMGGYQQYTAWSNNGGTSFNNWQALPPLTTKSYTVNTTVNSNVSPFSAYGTLDLTNDVASYGNIIAIEVNNNSTNPAVTMLAGGRKTIFVYSATAKEGITLVVTFAKNTLIS